MTDKSEIDVLTIGETLVDFISTEPVESLRDATTFQRHQGGSPANIAVNGSTHLHTVNDVRYPDVVHVKSLDAGLVCVSHPNPFPVPPPTDWTRGGASFVLYDNIWSTNFIQWFPYLPGEENQKFRFALAVVG